MNFDRLRFVAERAELGEAREAIFAVSIPERPGSFREFCALLGNRSVTEFNYRFADAKTAHIFVGVEVAGRHETRKLLAAFRNGEDRGIRPHRQRNGQVACAAPGRRPRAGGRNEILYRFEFPERPGALMRFLNSMSAGWNISLFHYRNHGADYGRVLVGYAGPAGRQGRFPALSCTVWATPAWMRRTIPPTRCSWAREFVRAGRPTTANPAAPRQDSVPKIAAVLHFERIRRRRPIPARFML